MYVICLCKGKGKGSPYNRPRRPRGRADVYSSTLPSTSALDGCVATATPRPLYPRERPGTLCIGGWVGPRTGLAEYGKSRPPPVFDPRTVQPVASRYTDCAIPVPFLLGTYHLHFFLTYQSCVTLDLLPSKYFVIFDLDTLFIDQFAAIFVIYLHTKLHSPDINNTC